LRTIEVVKTHNWREAVLSPLAKQNILSETSCECLYESCLEGVIGLTRLDEISGEFAFLGRRLLVAQRIALAIKLSAGIRKPPKVARALQAAGSPCTHRLIVGSKTSSYCRTGCRKLSSTGNGAGV